MKIYEKGEKMLHDSFRNGKRRKTESSSAAEFAVFSQHNHKNDRNVRDEPLINKENIEVSIIIPSFNRYPLNLFTLYSLENQTFDVTKMEVIVIDDASTDQTEEHLRNYHPPFHFQYIRNERNLGRAKVRNIGINASRGSLLIFLDAEMLTTPDFVNHHYRYHQKDENVILTGVMNCKNVITCLFPEQGIEKHYEIPQRIRKSAKFIEGLSNYRSDAELPHPLIDKTDIINQDYTDLIIKTSTWFNMISANFGENLEGFQFPWMAFLTGNVSLRKDLIAEAGMFDEDFEKYGYEDWELGYRLYKRGAKFLIKDNLTAYHQEHPIGENRWKEAVYSLNLFISKHHDVDVLIMGVELAGFAGLLTVNNMLYEYKMLIEKYPREFPGFQEKFITILETIAEMLLIDIRHFNVLGAAGFGKNQKKELLDDIERIKTLKDYPALTAILLKIIHS